MAGPTTKLGVSSGMPRSMAVFFTLAVPTSTAICAYTALTERSVAVLTVMFPYEIWPSFSGAKRIRPPVTGRLLSPL